MASNSPDRAVIRKELQTKARQIVEALLESSVEPDFFLAAVTQLSRGDYEDVIEERALLQLCGYPLCSSKLSKAPAQKYHISLSKKKVYNLEEYNNFCSRKCMKASQHVRQQILTGPVWLRDPKAVPVVTLIEQGKDEPCTDLTKQLEELSVQQESACKPKPRPKSVARDPVQYSEKCLREWFTLNVLRFLIGDDAVKDLITQYGKNWMDYFGNQTEKEDREEHKTNNLKIQAYLKGITEVDVDDDSDSNPVFPLGDSWAQKLLQKRLVLERLNKSVSDVLEVMGLSIHCLNEDLVNFFDVAELSRDNVVFRPQEWRYLGIAFVKILSLQNELVRDTLYNTEVEKKVALLLMEFDLDIAYLNRLISYLTEIHYLLEKGC